MRRGSYDGLINCGTCIMDVGAEGSREAEWLHGHHRRYRYGDVYECESSVRSLQYRYQTGALSDLRAVKK